MVFISTVKTSNVAMHSFSAIGLKITNCLVSNHSSFTIIVLFDIDYKTNI